MSGKEESFLFAVVSDTHGHVSYTRTAVNMLESLGPRFVVHCGDIGTPEIVEMFAPWPTHYVFGNCDVELDGLRAAMRRVGHTCHERRGEIDVAGKSIAFLHGDDPRALQWAIQCGDYALVCHGHTHQARQEQHGPTGILNPGALYRAFPHSFAIVELPSWRTTLVTV